LLIVNEWGTEVKYCTPFFRRYVMGAYRYCVNPKCDGGNGLPKPDVEDDLITGSSCPHCGTEQPQARSVEEWLIEAFDRILELEKEVKELKSRTRPFKKLMVKK
jgi:hypothetical protein